MRGAGCGILAAEQDDGGFGGVEESLLEGRNLTLRLDGRQRRKHEREGLFLAVLQLAQAADGFVVVRRNDQVETAEALDGDDLALAQGVRGGGNWRARRRR